MPEPRYDIISLGRLAIDLYADEVGVELSQVKNFSMYAGGCPTNVAVGTRRLGLRVAMASRVGVDSLSDGLVDFLTAEGVDTQYVVRDADHLTGMAFLSIMPPDTFPLVYYRPDPADIQMTLDDIASIPFGQTRVLFTAGTRFSAEPSRSTTLIAMKRAHDEGAEVVLDFDLRPTLWGNPRTFGVNVRSSLPFVDVAIGTEEEITAAADESSVEAAVPVLLEQVHKAVAVKRGQDGSEVYTKGGDCYRAAPFTVDVLNVLGAGDAWASGFIFGYMNGWSWQKCARMGNATGAMIVTRHACANDMPVHDEVMAFIEQKGGY